MGQAKRRKMNGTYPQQGTGLLLGCPARWLSQEQQREFDMITYSLLCHFEENENPIGFTADILHAAIRRSKPINCNALNERQDSLACTLTFDKEGPEKKERYSLITLSNGFHYLSMNDKAITILHELWHAAARQNIFPDMCIHTSRRLTNPEEAINVNHEHEAIHDLLTHALLGLTPDPEEWGVRMYKGQGHLRDLTPEELYERYLKLTQSNEEAA
jgi:hypothetical protein